MARVRRNEPNTLVFRKATVRLQSRPGPDPDAALARVPYVIRAGGAAAPGLTRPDGSLTLRFPPEGTVCVEIFGTTFEISPAAPPPPVETPEGTARRLAMLGYPGDLEAAVLAFQADHGLEPKGLEVSGIPDGPTRDRLKTEAGI